MTARDDARNCRLCPRACGVNRLAGERGYCRAGDQPVLYRHGTHDGEEPPISGTRGSGTVFFSHCTLRCRYCQNYPWSQEHRGLPVHETVLADRLRALDSAQCHNWNLVSPTPWWPWIAPAVAALEKHGIRRPIVYNSSGFEAEATLEGYAPFFDIALVDLRYARDTTAEAASGCANYVAISRRAVSWFHRVLGPLTCNPDDIAQRGVICRILVLPGHADEACANLEWIADNLGTDVRVSLMSQYTPVHRATEPPWNRRILAREYDRAMDTMENMGFRHGWIQPLESSPPEALLGCRMPPDTPREAASDASLH